MQDKWWHILVVYTSLTTTTRGSSQHAQFSLQNWMFSVDCESCPNAYNRYPEICVLPLKGLFKIIRILFMRFSKLHCAVEPRCFTTPILCTMSDWASLFFVLCLLMSLNHNCCSAGRVHTNCPRARGFPRFLQRRMFSWLLSLEKTSRFLLSVCAFHFLSPVCSFSRTLWTAILASVVILSLTWYM